MASPRLLSKEPFHMGMSKLKRRTLFQRPNMRAPRRSAHSVRFLVASCTVAALQRESARTKNVSKSRGIHLKKVIVIFGNELLKLPECQERAPFHP